MLRIGMCLMINFSDVLNHEEIRNENLLPVISELFFQRGAKLAIAESVTGGLINALMVALPGASKFLEGGVIAYSNAIKVNLLGVGARTIQRFGVVSKETATEMALGVKRLFHVPFSLATTGYAGPQAGSERVGHVVIAVAGPHVTTTREFIFEGSRTTVIEQAAFAALGLLKLSLEEEING